MLRLHGSPRYYWDMLILLLAIVFCYILPVEIAFDPFWKDSTIYLVLKVVVALFFAIDIAINFNTTWYDYEGNEIYNRKVIAREYVL